MFSHSMSNISTQEIKLLMQDARIKYQFKRNQLIKGLGRDPTSKEMEEVANSDIFALHIGSTLLRGRNASPTVPDSFLVQIHMAKLRT